MDLKKLAKDGLEYACEKKYDKLLASKCISYNDWIVQKEEGLEHYNLALSEDCDEALSGNGALLTNTEFTCKYENINFRIVPMDICCFGFNVRQYIEDIVVFVNGSISEIAIPLIADFFIKYQKAIVLYGDEDIISQDGIRTNPYFKPDFSPNEFLKHFYFCNLVAIRRSAFRELDWTGEMSGAASLYHNLLRLIYSDKKYVDYGVGRVEGVLVHCRDYSNSFLTDSSAEKFASRLLDGEIVSAGDDKDGITVVICTKDHPQMLETCLKCLELSKGDFSLEYIVVDNGSSEDNRNRIIDISNEIGFRYIYEPSEFNFSKMCNIGASQATKPMLLFLNDDVEITDSLALQHMWHEAAYAFVGAAGLKLLYPEEERIQHAGIVNIPFGPVHKLQGLPDNKDYYFGFNRVTSNRIGVTGACLMIRRSTFQQLKGFDEEFPVAYNDVDLCYRLLEKGLYIACCNEVSAIHRESVTRGADIAPAKAERLMRDRERLYRLHPLIGRKDPFYNSYLINEALDVRIVPGNEYSISNVAERPEKIERQELSDAREDKCLKVSVEYAGKHQDFNGEASAEILIQGYGVLTGSNNACYSKTLLLKKGTEIFGINVEGSLRNDISLAFPKEKKVELSGFTLLIPEGLLPDGEYQLGMLFKRDFSKEKIYNFTDRILTIGE